MGFKLATLLLGLAVIALVIWLLPLASGNPHVTRLVHSFEPKSSPDGLVVQLTFTPRIRTDLRALLEDADDVGCLTADDTGFKFQGDSVQLSVPFDLVKQVKRKHRGLRSLFVPCIVVIVPSLPNIKSVEFRERSSLLLPASRRASQKLYEMLRTKIRTQP
jgi:hypothetical protein